MFDIKGFETADSAAMYMWDYFRQFTWTAFGNQSTFNIVHSVSQEEIITEQVDFDNLFEQIISFIRDLDCQEGIYFDNEEGMSFDESPIAQDRIYEQQLDKKNPDFGLAGEGFLVIKNQFASAKGEYPFIIIKPSLFILTGDIILSSLKMNTPVQDYTSKVVPAVYIELGDK